MSTGGGRRLPFSLFCWRRPSPSRSVRHRHTHTHTSGVGSWEGGCLVVSSNLSITYVSPPPVNSSRVPFPLDVSRARKRWGVLGFQSLPCVQSSVSCLSASLSSCLSRLRSFFSPPPRRRVSVRIKGKSWGCYARAGRVLWLRLLYIFCCGLCTGCLPPPIMPSVATRHWALLSPVLMSSWRKEDGAISGYGQCVNERRRVSQERSPSSRKRGGGLVVTRTIFP